MGLVPYKHQLTLAEQGYNILCKYKILYLATEERTGKTLTSLLITEKCLTINKILIVTKKQAISGWQDTLNNYSTNKIYFVTNYHQVKNFNKLSLLR